LAENLSKKERLIHKCLTKRVLKKPLLEDPNYDLENNDSKNILGHDFAINYIFNCSMRVVRHKWAKIGPSYLFSENAGGLSAISKTVLAREHSGRI